MKKRKTPRKKPNPGVIRHAEPPVEHQEPPTVKFAERVEEKSKIPIVDMVAVKCPGCGSIRSWWKGSERFSWGRLIRRKCKVCGKRYDVREKNSHQK